MTTGKFFGMRFKLRSLLGKGSLGHTFLAVDALRGDSEVALKILHQKYTGRPGFVPAFTLSASASSAFHHPYVRRVVDYGKLDNHLFFTMDYRPSKTLREWLSQTLSFEERVLGGLPFLIKILSTMQVLHERGLFAMIKPENIFLDGDQIQLSDYWLPPLIPPIDYNQNEEARKYLPYFAPEIKEDWSQLSPQSDYYSIGVLLHEILLGAPPLEVPKIPSVCSPMYNKEVDVLTSKALYPTPEKRIRSVEEFIQSITHIHKALSSKFSASTSQSPELPEVRVPSRPLYTAPLGATQAIQTLKEDIPEPASSALNAQFTPTNETLRAPSSILNKQADGTHSGDTLYFEATWEPDTATVVEEERELKASFLNPGETAMDVTPDPFAAMREERDLAALKTEQIREQQSYDFNEDRNWGGSEVIQRFRESSLPLVLLLIGVFIILLSFVLALF